MADASYAIGNFTAGEISQFAQGRFDKPDYRNSLKVCLNSLPVEIGSWVRRPGTRHGGHTRGGVQARVVKFDFKQDAPVTLELVDGFVRFRQGASLLTTNDENGVLAISAANPAVVQVNVAAFPTGSTVIFEPGPGSAPALLQNRQFLTSQVDGTHLSLQDAITGANIDGSTLGPFTVLPIIARIQELATPYVGGSWASIRMVQAETTGILLQGSVSPQALTVVSPFGAPGSNIDAQFALNPATFNDGPYLDPFTNGVQATPSATSGIVTLSLGFATYVATKAYPFGAFVTFSGTNYESLVDQNVGNQPDTHPSQWQAKSASAAINNGQGFLGTDIGRAVRLFSEPPQWSATTTYVASTSAAPVTVSYNPSGVDGATLYYESQTGTNLNHPPGSDLTNWKLIPQGAAIWTWGRIVGLSNIIDRALSGSTSIGDMTGGGGLNAAFDGIFAQDSSTSAQEVVFGGFVHTGTFVSLTSYVGKNYSGASDQKIQQATVYASTDRGFAYGTYFAATPNAFIITSLIFNLRGKASAPANSADGTLLGTVTLPTNSLSAVTIVSTDQTTAWKYVWVEMISNTEVGGVGANSYNLTNIAAQLSLFSPTGTGTSSGVNAEILGPPLLYTAPVLTWRLGLYSNTTGWPTCGTYDEGRLYLGGAVGNRFDACVSNGIVGGTINFAPTDQYGAVSPASAISYTFNSNGVNQILWMDPDLQGIKMGTQAGEWLVVAPTAGPISAINISARNVTNHGSANIQPCRTEHTTIFVQRFARKLLEYFPDVFSGKFSAPNLADKTIRTRAGVAELAYTSAVTPIIWGRDTLGALFGITYKRDSLASAQPPTFYGWHGHSLGSGRVVESICAGPSIGGDLDALTMVTNDPATNIRHVEVLTDTPDELSDLANAWYLDDAVTPTSTSAVAIGTGFPYGGLTLNGLWHLNGKTVQVFAGGLDCGDPGEGKPIADFVVANGSLSIAYGDSISAGAGRGLFTSDFVATNPPIVVGFTYTSDGQLVRPIAQADTGARNGPAFGKLTRAHRYALSVVNTLGLMVGGTFNKLRPANFKQPNNSALPALTAFTGISQDALDDDYLYDGGLCWRVTRPFPANVVVAGVNQATQDQ